MKEKPESLTLPYEVLTSDPFLAYLIRINSPVSYFPISRYYNNKIKAFVRYLKLQPRTLLFFEDFESLLSGYHLRHLDLSHCMIENSSDLGQLSSLKKLEILSLSNYCHDVDLSNLKNL